MEMDLGRILVEVSEREVEDLAPRGIQRMHVSREGSTQKVEGTAVGNGVEPLWS
jgi:hypothetical protein